MINFKLSTTEITELILQIPNFEVILKALDEHPNIVLNTDLVTDLQAWIDFPETAM